MTLAINLLAAAIIFGTPLMFGTLGEILTEKSGNLNLGVEGIMFMGGAFGLAGVYYYESLAKSPSIVLAVLVALIAAFIAGAFAALIFSFLTITLRTNQNVTGLALAIFGTGAGQFMGTFMRENAAGSYVTLSNELKEAFLASPFPEVLQRIPYAGKVLFGNSLFFYLGVLLAVGMHLFLSKSRTGLYLRAVGESPSTADTAGINVSEYKYTATIIGGGISAIGGMVYITTTSGCTWNHTALSGVGWLSVALVIFCMWRPLAAIWGSVLFGGLMILYLYLHLSFMPQDLYMMLPYIVTVIVLILTSLRNKREQQPPEALGLSFFREER